ncbi:MAG: hypothetical protein ACAI37_07605 [Chthoniobacter sp.]
MRGTKTPSVGEPYWDKTTSRLFIGDGATAGGLGVGGQRGYQEIAIAGASSTTTITFPLGLAAYLGIGAVTGGGSDFTRKIVLPTAGRIAGDVARFKIVMPVSSHPTVSFHHAADTNAALATLPPDAVTARTYLAEFHFDGTAWQLLETRQQL